jgi:hypothetical protein
MLHTLSHDEYISWMAYYSVEPFPEERADLRNATLIAAISAMLGGKGKVDDLLVDYWRITAGKQQKQSPEEVASRLQALFAALDKKGGGKR